MTQKGVVKIKKVLLIVLIPILLISLSAISAANTTHTDSKDTTIKDTVKTYSTNDVSKTKTINKKESQKTNKNTTKKSSTTNAYKIKVHSKTTYSNKKVTFSAHVTHSSSNAPATNGQVVFKLNGKTMGVTKVTNGNAYCTYKLPRMSPKKYTITGKYVTPQYEAVTSTGTLTIISQKKFTYKQIKKAAVKLRTKFEANKKVKTIKVGSTKMGLQDFLPLMIKASKNVYNGKGSSKVKYVHYKKLSSQIDTLKPGVFQLREMINIGNTVLTHLKQKNIPPKSVKTRLGRIGFYNIAYSYSKMLDVSEKTYMPESCRVYSWKKIHPKNSKVRKIYITSDNIYNYEIDKAFMKKIRAKLMSKGYKVKLAGIGPNTHNVKIWDGSLPDNAVQLSIFGGADAGVIYDVTTRSFMRTKANRLVFFVYYSATSKDIRKLSWLERAHDDNYTPSSFTGISNPSAKLRNHGYDYVYTTSVDSIVNSLIKYIS